eukprot:1191258-Karenia_brevis.AAC.1
MAALKLITSGIRPPKRISCHCAPLARRDGRVEADNVWRQTAKAYVLPLPSSHAEMAALKLITSGVKPPK